MQHILESVQRILPELNTGGKIAYEKTDRLATQRVLKYTCELRVTIRYAVLHEIIQNEIRQ